MDPGTPLSAAIAQANQAMKLTPSGTLPEQVDRLLLAMGIALRSDNIAAPKVRPPAQPAGAAGPISGLPSQTHQRIRAPSVRAAHPSTNGTSHMAPPPSSQGVASGGNVRQAPIQSQMAHPESSRQPQPHMQPQRQRPPHMQPQRPPHMQSEAQRQPAQMPPHMQPQRPPHMLPEPQRPPHMQPEAQRPPHMQPEAQRQPAQRPPHMQPQRPPHTQPEPQRPPHTQPEPQRPPHMQPQRPPHMQPRHPQQHPSQAPAPSSANARQSMTSPRAPSAGAESMVSAQAAPPNTIVAGRAPAYQDGSRDGGRHGDRPTTGVHGCGGVMASTGTHGVIATTSAAASAAASDAAAATGSAAAPSAHGHPSGPVGVVPAAAVTPAATSAAPALTTDSATPAAPSMPSTTLNGTGTARGASNSTQPTTVAFALPKPSLPQLIDAALEHTPRARHTHARVKTCIPLEQDRSCATIGLWAALRELRSQGVLDDLLRRFAPPRSSRTMPLVPTFRRRSVDAALKHLNALSHRNGPIRSSAGALAAESAPAPMEATPPVPAPVPADLVDVSDTSLEGTLGGEAGCAVDAGADAGADAGTAPGASNEGARPLTVPRPPPFEVAIICDGLLEKLTSGALSEQATRLGVPQHTALLAAAGDGIEHLLLRLHLYLGCSGRHGVRAKAYCVMVGVNNILGMGAPCMLFVPSLHRRARLCGVCCVASHAVLACASASPLHRQ